LPSGSTSNRPAGVSCPCRARWRNQDAAIHAHAEVAAGRRNPALRIAPARRGAERFCCNLEWLRIGDHTYSQCSKSAATWEHPGNRGQPYNEILKILPAEDQRDRLEVVLVSPRNPLNIGAVARAMANFGFSRLAVVAAMRRIGVKRARQWARPSCSARPRRRIRSPKPSGIARWLREQERSPIVGPSKRVRLPTWLRSSPANSAMEGASRSSRTEKHGLSRKIFPIATCWWKFRPMRASRR